MAKHGMKSTQAKQVKEQGHRDEKEFAQLIGMTDAYNNGLTQKKDVVDKNGDTHSIKGGKEKWQIFLYGKKRFETDNLFRVMGGIGDGVGKLILSCIDCFPQTYSNYAQNKEISKSQLKSKMLALCGKLQDDDVFSAFLELSLFNGGEVTYLTIKKDDIFHIFLKEDVISAFKKLKRATSIARSHDQENYLKVVFENNGKQVGTIEIRTDKSNYRSAMFQMNKKPTFDLLASIITNQEKWGDKVAVYGKAIGKFEDKHRELLCGE